MSILQTEQILHNFEDQKFAIFSNHEQVNFRVTLVIYIVYQWISLKFCLMYILSRATFPGAPSYGDVRTWVEGSQTCVGSHVGWSLQPTGLRGKRVTLCMTVWHRRLRTFIQLIFLLRTIKLSTNNVQYICLVNTDQHKHVNEVGSRQYIACRNKAIFP